jgi:HSP20 family protein
MTYTLLPPGGMTNLRREMDQLLDSLWREEVLEPGLPGTWSPKVDLSETKEQIVVRAEIPGIRPEDLHVEYRDGMLTLRGEKKREMEEKSERFYRMERAYGAFVRSIRLPAPADARKVQASFKQGVLVVTLPKAPEAAGTNVPIQTD